MRDDIQPKRADDIRLAAMIYQVCDLDKKILQKMYPFLQYFLVRRFQILMERSPLAPSDLKDGILSSRYT